MATSRLLRTKDVDDVIRQNDDPVGGEAHHTRLSKRLTAWDLMGFGIGIVIGTGIFTLTGIQAKNNAGPAIVISFAIAGVVSLLAALCYAELAAAVPTAGSSYTYAYTTIGEIFAWIIAWDLILEFALGAAVVSRGWSGYLQDALNLPTSVFGEESTVNLGAIAIALVLGVVAMIGIRESKWVTNALVVIKVSVCVFVIVLGIFFVKAANLAPFVPPSRAGARGRGPERPPAAAVAVDQRRRRRPRSASPASSSRRPSCSSPTAASRRSPTSARRPRTRPRTCRAACSARWRSARCSTSWSAW